MAGIQKLHDQFQESDVRVVALSADSEDGAREMKADEGLDFPVLYGLECEEIRQRFGVYVEEDGRSHLQPAQFIVDPGGTVRFASYSSGKVGRLGAQEALDEIEVLRDGNG